jgi:hypothetical protein
MTGSWLIAVLMVSPLALPKASRRMTPSVWVMSCGPAWAGLLCLGQI